MAEGEKRGVDFNTQTREETLGIGGWDIIVSGSNSGLASERWIPADRGFNKAVALAGELRDATQGDVTVREVGRGSDSMEYTLVQPKTD